MQNISVIMDLEVVQYGWIESGMGVPMCTCGVFCEIPGLEGDRLQENTKSLVSQAKYLDLIL